MSNNNIDVNDNYHYFTIITHKSLGFRLYIIYYKLRQNLPFSKSRYVNCLPGFSLITYFNEFSLLRNKLLRNDVITCIKYLKCENKILISYYSLKLCRYLN